ncbi:MAG: phosphate acetyltransferase [Gemmatimonadaceae bacterium]
MTFLDEVRARAGASRRRLVFPESSDPRTLDAVTELARLRMVEPILVLDPAAPQTHPLAAATGVQLVDPASDARAEHVVDELLAARAQKGLTRERAAELARTSLYFADALVRWGDADGCVAGAAHTTADVLRAALWLIGPAPGVRTVSSAFYMITPPFRGGTDLEVLTFTDCAVVPYPSPSQLADIALAAATDRRRIVGDEPRVAMLSFSTRGSGSGPSVDAVRDATAQLHRRSPALAVDGELQGDAALIAAVGARKAPRSRVAGQANVLVFPSLDAGNIAYKLVQRLAGASAIGPIVQGLRKPCSDLSRGAAVEDIINVAAITALQADAPPA